MTNITLRKELITRLPAGRVPHVLPFGHGGADDHDSVRLMT